MALSLKVKLFYVLGIVHSLWVDLLISNQNALPNRLISLLEADVQELSILNAPVAIVNFDLLAQLSLNERFLLLDLDVELVCFGALRDWDLDLDIEY